MAVESATSQFVQSLAPEPRQGKRKQAEVDCFEKRTSFSTLQKSSGTVTKPPSWNPPTLPLDEPVQQIEQRHTYKNDNRDHGVSFFFVVDLGNQVTRRHIKSHTG